MSNKLQKIFDYQQGVDLNITIGSESIRQKLMSKGKFVYLLGKILTETSTGKKFETLEELHEYLGLIESSEKPFLSTETLNKLDKLLFNYL